LTDSLENDPLLPSGSGIITRNIIAFLICLFQSSNQSKTSKKDNFNRDISDWAAADLTGFKQCNIFALVVALIYKNFTAILKKFFRN